MTAQTIRRHSEPPPRTRGAGRGATTSVHMRTRYTGWTHVHLVLDDLSIETLPADDMKYLQLCVDAANRAVAFWRPDLTPPSVLETTGPFADNFAWQFQGGAWDADYLDWMIVLGATMMATSWFQRRGADIGAFAEFGGPPPAIGRDVEQLLRINRAARPVIA